MGANRPDWLEALNEEDLQFLKRFVLGSGSLKALAEAYGVSYPTVRARLDRLIAKVRAADGSPPSDPFRRQLEILLADQAVGAEAARELLAAHRRALEQAAQEGRSEDTE